VRLQRELFGEQNPSVMRSKEVLGVAERHLGNPERARDLLAEAVKRAKRSEHAYASTLQIVDNLAEAWRDLGELDKAEQCHRETMAGFEKLVGPDAQLTIGCGYHLLKVLYLQGKREPLQTLAAELLTRCERTFGKDDYRTLDVLQVLAVAIKDGGDVAQAAKLMQRAFDGVAKDRGEVHPATFSAGHNLAKARLAAHDRQGSLAISKHLIDLLAREPDPAKQLPPPFPGITWLLRAKALLLDEQTDDAKAAAATASKLLQLVMLGDDPRLVEAIQIAGEGK